LRATARQKRCRDSAADGRDTDGKKGQPLDAQWFSLLRHRWEANRPRESAFLKRAHFSFREPAISVPMDWHFEGVFLTVLREMAGTVLGAKQAEPALFFPLLVRAIDQAMVADQFLGEVGRRMPVNERVRSASRFNATMRAAILILAD
jgi:hypothetical protein